MGDLGYGEAENICINELFVIIFYSICYIYMFKTNSPFSSYSGVNKSEKIRKITFDSARNFLQSVAEFDISGSIQKTKCPSGDANLSQLLKNFADAIFVTSDHVVKTRMLKFNVSESTFGTDKKPGTNHGISQHDFDKYRKNFIELRTKEILALTEILEFIKQKGAANTLNSEDFALIQKLFADYTVYAANSENYSPYLVFVDAMKDHDWVKCLDVSQNDIWRTEMRYFNVFIGCDEPNAIMMNQILMQWQNLQTEFSDISIKLGQSTAQPMLNNQSVNNGFKF